MGSYNQSMYNTSIWRPFSVVGHGTCGWPKATLHHCRVVQSKLCWKWRWTPETSVSTMVTCLMTSDIEANATERGIHIGQYVCSGSETKGTREELSAHTSFWSWGPRGESFNASLGCLHNVLFCSGAWSRCAHSEACRAPAHWCEEKEILASSPSFLPRGREASFGNSQPSPSDPSSSHVMLLPAPRAPTSCHRASYLTSLAGLSHKASLEEQNQTSPRWGGRGHCISC